MFSGWSAKRQGKAPVTVMIDCEVGKGLLSHHKRSMQALLAARSLRRLGKGREDTVEVCLTRFRIADYHVVILAEPVLVPRIARTAAVPFE